MITEQQINFTRFCLYMACIIGMITGIGILLNANTYSSEYWNLKIQNEKNAQPSEDMWQFRDKTDTCSYYMTLENLTACEQCCEVLYEK